MTKPGSVVIATLAGAVETKLRPAVVLSSELYQQHRPDLVLGVLSTRPSDPAAPFNYALQDWAEAGLQRPSTFRTYLGMAPADQVRILGELSERDWEGVQSCLALALGAGESEAG